MRLTLGPLQYCWPRDRILAFYDQAARWPLDVIYLGETVCSKRRELRTADWLALAAELADQDLEVVLSSLALLEAESELATLGRLVDNGRFRVEANDMSAVQLLRLALCRGSDAERVQPRRPAVAL
jgi:collagenase-like PrtC family protease